MSPTFPPLEPENRALVGILMLETTFPRIPGDVGNPATFPFPVRYETVTGATPERVVMEADPLLLQPFVEAGKRLVRSGVKALATSCGFLALFHRELTSALEVPVFTSSLLQVPLASALLPKRGKVGILTARKASLTPRHLEAVGIGALPLAVQGMEASGEFAAVFLGGKTTLDVDRCRREMEAAALRLVTEHPDVGAVVLECTNMPPYAADVRRVTGRPVFDAVTLIEQAHAAVRE
jgi:hypothetical protein